MFQISPGEVPASQEFVRNDEVSSAGGACLALLMRTGRPLPNGSVGQLESEQAESLGEVWVIGADRVLGSCGERVGGFPDRPVLDVVAET